MLRDYTVLSRHNGWRVLSSEVVQTLESVIGADSAKLQQQNQTDNILPST